MFVQEIQDNNGETNDAVVSANLTLTTLTSAINSLGGPAYDFAQIDPVDDKNGGAPGGNIRTAYLYNPEILRLRKPNFGSSIAANEVLAGPELKYNPGLIDPTNAAWTASRKPLVAAFETLDGKSSFFTINVHFGSKGGSSSIEGDARPPVNGGVDDRQEQMQLTAVSCSEFCSQGSILTVYRNLLPKSLLKTSRRRSSSLVTSTSLPLSNHSRTSKRSLT